MLINESTNKNMLFSYLGLLLEPKKRTIQFGPYYATCNLISYLVVRWLLTKRYKLSSYNKNNNNNLLSKHTLHFLPQAFSIVEQPSPSNTYSSIHQ